MHASWQLSSVSDRSSTIHHASLSEELCQQLVYAMRSGHMVDELLQLSVQQSAPIPFAEHFSTLRISFQLFYFPRAFTFSTTMNSTSTLAHTHRGHRSGCFTLVRFLHTRQSREIAADACLRPTSMKNGECRCNRRLCKCIYPCVHT